MRWRRALLAGTTLGLFAVVPLGAAESPVIAEDAGWYSALSVRQGELIADPVAASTLAQGDLPIGATGNAEHKRSYLRLGLPEDTIAATITLERSASDGANFGAPGPILACPLAGPFAVTTGKPIAEAPEIDCDAAQAIGQVPELEEGVPDPEGAYTFDLTPLVLHWNSSAAEPAIALVADVSEPQGTYQVTLFAEPFSQIGTATTGSAANDDSFVFDPILPGAPPNQGDSPFVSSDAFAFVPPSLEPQQPERAVVAPPGGDDDTLGEAPVLASGPPVDLDPLPVNPAVWLLLPLGLGTLLVSGRRLSPSADPVTSLDRLLRR